MSREQDVFAIESAILNGLPDAVIWVTPVRNEAGEVTDFQVEFSNVRADEVIAHPDGSLTGLHILRDGVPSRGLAQENFQSFLNVYLTGKGDHSFYLPSITQSLEVERRKLLDGVLSITRDKKQQRQAELKANEQSRLVHNIVQNAPAGIVAYRAERNEEGVIQDFTIRLYNNMANQLTGFTAEDRKQKTLRTLLEGTGLENNFERYCRTVETGEPFSLNFYFARTEKWLHFFGVKLDDGFLSIINDVTDKHRHEEAVEHWANRLTQFINATRSGMALLRPVFDDRGEVTDFSFEIANQALAHFTGKEVEELIGRRIGEVLPGYLESGRFERYKQIFLHGETERFTTHFIEGEEDSWFDAMATPIEGGILVTVNDITDVKTLQLQLERTVDDLRRTNTNLEEFAYAASHDLKEPIRKIRVFAGRIRNDPETNLSPHGSMLFDRLDAATVRMGSLVDDLLTFSRISMRPVAFEEVDLSTLVSAVIDDLEIEIEEKKAILQMDKLPVVRGHSRQLQQLFQNLIGNSLKYSREGERPMISITCKRILGKDSDLLLNADDQLRWYYVISVKDNGIGFEQKDAERIFHLFQRLHGNAEYTGTGIGLAIARKVVENHQGFIRAKSEAGKGSCFQVFLPEDRPAGEESG